ncbi:MAG: hypothetical protein H6557_05595 [Lewinellaceae bacterium]|nr:hypothetical protein [Lewinellaceae bacterium]
MIKKALRNIEALFKLKTQILSLRKETEEQKNLTGRLFSEWNKTRTISKLSEVEFKVFSQYGDDGIINYLTSKLEVQNKTFVEFGVENYTESNTRFLLLNSNWSGLVMDGSEDNIAFIKKDDITRKYDLKSQKAFITAENINELLSGNNITGEIGLISIDIDGNDYWVWKAITVINPVIVVSEYNSIWGYDKPFTVPYDPNFFRTDYHYTNLVYGSSLLSLCDLAEEKGYYFVGCNTMGNNAYFIRKDRLGKILSPLSPEEGYSFSKFSESRGRDGSWTMLKGDARLRAILGVNVYDTRKKEVIKLTEKALGL